MTDKRRGDSPTVYWQRWYILTVAILSTISQGTVWNSWGPIAQSAKAAYGWSDTTITVLLNSGNAGILVALLLAGYITTRAGFRVAMLASTFLIALGAGLRIITMERNLATVLIGVGQFLAGVGGSFTQVIPPGISEAWFPVSERTTATSAVLMANILGGATVFILGPHMVNQPPRNHTDSIDESLNQNSTDQNSTAGFDLAEMKGQLWLYLVVEFAAAAVIFVLTLLYFPARPPTPPSRSASTQRLQFRELLSLLKNVRIWHITVICSAPLAVFGNWIGLIDVHFHRIGISQTEAGWIGLISSLGGAVSGVLIGRLADSFKRHLKKITLVLYAVSLLGLLWTVLMVTGLIPHSVVLVGLSTTVINSAINAATPLIYEMSCETGYPAAEELMAMLLGFCFNLGGVVYLLVQLIPNIGTLWMTWAFLGTQAVAIPALAVFQQRYRRLDVDDDSLIQKQ